MAKYFNPALAAVLLLGATGAAAGEWADDVRRERDARPPAQAQLGSRLNRPVMVAQAWALFPPQAATRGLQKEPRGSR